MYLTLADFSKPLVCIQMLSQIEKEIYSAFSIYTNVIHASGM